MSELRSFRSSLWAAGWWGAVAVLAAGVSLGVGEPVQAVQPAPVDLSGEWVLNREQSDDMRKIAQRMMRPRGVGKGVLSGGGLSGGLSEGGKGDAGSAGSEPRGGQTGGDGSGETRVAVDNPRLLPFLSSYPSSYIEMARARNAGKEELAIVMVEGGVQITDALHRAGILRPDRQWRAAAMGEKQSYWKKSKLVSKNRGRQQAPTVREYSLNKRGQLIVHIWIQFPGEMGTATFKRVYDRRDGT